MCLLLLYFLFCLSFLFSPLFILSSFHFFIFFISGVRRGRGGGGAGGGGGVILSSPAKVRSSVQAKTEQKLNVLMALQGPNHNLHEN